MNRNRLKAYAPRARRDFIRTVTDRAAVYGLTKKGNEPVFVQGDVGLIGGKPFSKDVVEKRKRLVERIEREGFEQVMEAMAYTWFNRFVAIRFMEVHGYLDHGYKVLGTTNNTNSTNAKKGGQPEILSYAEHVDLPGVDRERMVELKLAGNRDDELYRMLLVGQCNALHKAMPFLFERIGDATELLLPENLLHSDSLIRRMVNEVPEEEWQEVEILGWLYQFYISEKKDQVIGKVVKSEDIPAATQLFTPNWIVKYMVQNTVGRQWLATYPDSPLRKLMEYYIEPGEQTPDVMEQIRAMTPESLNPVEMTLADVACGSGHILVEGYDLFKAIYQERGYRAKDIPRLTLEKNLYGLDIDDRAAQLAAFALMMKARADDRRIFDRGIRLNVMAIQNSPKVDDEALEVLTTNYTNYTNEGKDGKDVVVRVGDLRGLLELFENGKTFGSLIRVPEELGAKLPVIADRVEDVLAHGEMFGKATAEAISPIVQQSRILGGTYDASVTNPPYMGGKFHNPRLKAFLKTEYADYEKDLFSAFIAGSHTLAKRGGHIGFMAPFVWMFISSYENLRNFLIDHQTITSLVHLEYSGFDGATVPICTFTLKNAHYPNFKGGYVRLSDFRGAENQGPKTLEAIRNPTCGWFFLSSPHEFKRIPGSPIAYWVSDNERACFADCKYITDELDIKSGLLTGNDELFLRVWYEVSIKDIRYDLTHAREIKQFNPKWLPVTGGGEFRKWYGNLHSIVNSHNDFFAIRSLKGNNFRLRNSALYFRKAVNWPMISSVYYGAKLSPPHTILGNGVRTGFPRNGLDSSVTFCVSYLSSVVANNFLRIINPTLNYNNENIASIPLNFPIDKDVCNNGDRNIQISKVDWDSSETSWDFANHPLLPSKRFEFDLKTAYSSLRLHWREMTLKTQCLEEKNNRILIDAYGLQDELTPDVPLSEITLTCNPHYRYGPGKSEEELEALLRADTMKELVSYAVGCMMGRYSLDAPGLIYAHSGNDQFWEIYHEKHNQPLPPSPKNYSCNSCNSWLKFPPDADGIIPITDIDWFPDDAANRFFRFISVAWPKEHLEENLAFISDSLSPNRGESPRETIRRYMATGFFKHHLKMYKKRPIYWLFTSGKLRAFQCLVYLHRYNAGTLSRMRTEYVIPLQGKFAARIEQLAGDMDAATSTAHRKKVEKERNNLVKQQAELQAFDEKLRHYADMRISLDLDEGVKVNYGKFGDLLAEVNAITGKH